MLEMADRMVRILNSAESIKSFGVKSLSIANKHSLEMTMEKHEKLYETLVYVSTPIGA